TATHPPRNSRIEAIIQGWREFERLDNGIPSAPPLPSPQVYNYKVRFEGDLNLYYITTRNEVVWYDNYAEPITLGKFLESDLKSYAFELTWEDNRFYIDNRGKIWNLTAYNVMMPVGEIESLSSK
ncbi:MAG: hypothetical protein HKN32_08735, partial [Flavobacteriales bacterium]|nr:hypothetical protein [Flavobacteriales bacterium]